MKLAVLTERKSEFEQFLEQTHGEEFADLLELQQGRAVVSPGVPTQRPPSLRELARQASQVKTLHDLPKFENDIAAYGLQYYPNLCFGYEVGTSVRFPRQGTTLTDSLGAKEFRYMRSSIPTYRPDFEKECRQHIAMHPELTWNMDWVEHDIRTQGMVYTNLDLRTRKPIQPWYALLNDTFFKGQRVEFIGRQPVFDEQGRPIKDRFVLVLKHKDVIVGGESFDPDKNRGEWINIFCAVRPYYLS